MKIKTSIEVSVTVEESDAIRLADIAMEKDPEAFRIALERFTNDAANQVNARMMKANEAINPQST